MRPKPRVVIIVDERGPRLAQIAKTLGVLQNIVGGYVERWPYGPTRPTVYVNEDGIRLQLTVYAHLDGTPVHGAFVAMVDARDLTEADLKKFRSRLSNVH